MNNQICTKCGESGHFFGQHDLYCDVCDEQYYHNTEDCPKNKICLNCGKEGHMKSKCPQIKCTKCGEIGHFLEQHDLFCQVCQVGHQHNTENCRNIPPCKICGQYGHFKYYCPNSGQGSQHKDQESPYDPCDEIVDDDTSSIEEIEVFSSNSKSNDLGSNPKGSSGGSGMKLLSVRGDLFSDENSAGPSVLVEDPNPKGSSNRSQKSRSQDKASSSINRRSKSPTAQRSSRSRRSPKSKVRDQYSSSPSPPPVNKTTSPASSSAQEGAGSNPARVVKKPNIGFPASFAARKKSADSPKRNSSTPSLSPSPQRSNSPSLGRSDRSSVGSRRSKSPHGSRRSPSLKGSRRSPQPRSSPRERFETASGMRRSRRSPSPIR